MRVLHVYRTYFPDPPGGLQESIRQISLATRSQGVDARIFTLSPTPEPSLLERPEGPVTRGRSWLTLASCDIGTPDAIRKFQEAAAASDVIHYHFPWPFADLLHLGFAHGKPAIMTYHSDIVRQRILALAYAPLMNKMLRSMYAIVATSPVYAATSPVFQRISPASRCRVIPLGIVDYRSARHEADAASESLLRRHGLEKNNYFLSLGVLRYYKGLHDLVRASPSINGKVVIAGDGPERQSLHELNARFGIGNVVFTGQITESEKIVLLQNCRGLVLPSYVRSEAFGMVLVEAAMFGKPAVCCEVGSGTSYVNENEVTGLVVPPRSPERLAWAINRILASEEMAIKMGLAARERYERLFSGPALGKAYTQLYQEAAAKS